jgi:RNA recognition motif. (a.k.a. RRM, RBD, or RNP domain)
MPQQQQQQQHGLLAPVGGGADSVLPPTLDGGGAIVSNSTVQASLGQQQPMQAGLVAPQSQLHLQGTAGATGATGSGGMMMPPLGSGLMGGMMMPGSMGMGGGRGSGLMGGGGGGAQSGALAAAKSWKLFLGQVSYDFSEADMFPFFSQFGNILELALLRLPDGRNKGCGFLTYSTQAEAEAAIAHAHGFVMPNDPRGRPLTVKFAQQHR